MDDPRFDDARLAAVFRRVPPARLLELRFFALPVDRRPADFALDVLPVDARFFGDDFFDARLPFDDDDFAEARLPLVVDGRLRVLRSRPVPG